MDKQKQIIERALKFSEKYVYLELVRGSIESGQTCYCDNCGKLITNMVTVSRMSDKRKFTVGVDCAETLSKAKVLYNGPVSDYYMDIYGYNKAARVVAEIKKGNELDVSSSIWAHVTNSKGKTLECSILDLKKYFPEYLQA